MQAIYYRQSLAQQGTDPNAMAQPGTQMDLSRASNADAILQAAGASGADTVQQVTVNTPINQSPQTLRAPPETVNTAFVQTDSGVIAWAKKNPLLAAGVIVGGVLLIKELMKKK